MIKFEKTNTAVVASPIDIPLNALDVVPKVGHIPKRRTNVGFSFTRPFINTLKLLISIPPYSLVISSDAGSAVTALSPIAGAVTAAFLNDL
jgi:hypothetical protein